MMLKMRLFTIFIFFVYLIFFLWITMSLYSVEGNTGDKRKKSSVEGFKKNIIYVIDFKNVSASDSLKYLEISIPSAVVTALLKTDEFVLVEKRVWEKTIKAFADIRDMKNVLKIARSLNINAIVTGSFINIGDNIKINSKIINVETGNAVSGADATGKTGREVFELIDIIAEKLTKELQKSFGPEARRVIEVEKEVIKEIYIKDKKVDPYRKKIFRIRNAGIGLFIPGTAVLAVAIPFMVGGIVSAVRENLNWVLLLPGLFSSGLSLGLFIPGLVLMVNGIIKIRKYAGKTASNNSFFKDFAFVNELKLPGEKDITCFSDFVFRF